MRLEEMKKNIPETPEFIHRMIQQEVESQLRNANEEGRSMKRIKRWTVSRMAAAIAICVLATSSIAYAGVKLYHLYMEKGGTYVTETGIAKKDSNDKLLIPEKIYDIDITAEYIPEGMVWVDKDHLKYSENPRRTGGFSFASLLLEEQIIDKVMLDKNVIESEQRTFGQYEGVYLAYHDLFEDGSFNQRIYLLCPEVYRLITIYIGDDVAKEEAIKVVEHLVITENDTVMQAGKLDTWSDRMAQRDEIGVTLNTTIEDVSLPIHQLGDTFSLPIHYEANNGTEIRDGELSVCVNAVQISDDLQLLDQKYIPEEWADVVGEDGKLVPNTLYYIKSGNGTDSLDEIVKTEEVKQKLVYTTVTYTNTSDEEMSHVLYLGSLMLMNHKDGLYQIYIPKEQSGEDYDYIDWKGAASHAVLRYSDVFEDYGGGGNYISSLKPGESMQVNMAWIVNEHDLEHMYLNLNGEGGNYEFSKSTVKIGVVDIRQ